MTGRNDELFEAITLPMRRDATDALVAATIVQLAGVRAPSVTECAFRDATRSASPGTRPVTRRARDLFSGKPDVVLMSQGTAPVIELLALARSARARGCTPVLFTPSARRSWIAELCDAGARWVFRFLPDRWTILACLGVAVECARRGRAASSAVASTRCLAGFAVTLPALLCDERVVAKRGAAALDLALARGLPHREAEALVHLSVGHSVEASADEMRISASAAKRARRGAYDHVGVEDASGAAMRVGAVPKGRVPPRAARTPPVHSQPPGRGELVAL